MKIIFTKSFKKSLLKLDKNTQVRIVEKLDLFYDVTDNIYDLNLDVKKNEQIFVHFFVFNL